MFPTAVEERSIEEEVRRVIKEVKKLLEQLRMRTTVVVGDQDDSLYVQAENKRKKTSWDASK